MRRGRGTAPLDSGQAVLTRRPKSVSTALAAAILAAACSSGPEVPASGAPKAADIRALRWLAKDASIEEKIRVLTTRPVACRNVVAVWVLEPSDSDVSRQELGRLAFESPALLGGAAGRMGLSCASCHINGRGNPDFFLEAVSDRPGTADVTSGFFSKVRGDQTFNPVPIPDLAARDGKQIKDRTGETFRTKVHGLVVEEFDGQEPPAYVFDALPAYMDTLDMAGCRNHDAREAVSAESDWMDVDGAFKQAARLAGVNRRDAAIFMARVARERLERLHERFIAPDQREVRDAIVAASREIEVWARGSDGGAPPAGPALVSLERVRALAARHADRSLYNPEVLRAALAAE